MRALMAWLCLTVLAWADSPKPDVDFFERQIRPLLVEHCHACHGTKKQMAGLRLDSRAALLKGGESGSAYDANHPEQSLFLKVLTHQGDLKMPPKQKLPATAIAAFTHWFKTGVPWPDTTTTQVPDWRQHWAFQPVNAPPVPNIASVQTSIDRFIAAKLQTQGLTHSLATDKRTLIRRVTYDLTGLPPTPDEVDAFVTSTAADAYEQLVARLLKSPAFGEHWGRMWLDVARYADTKGYVLFEEANYPWAYTYRDYVIEAFNKDLPYNRFIMEQLAADRLVGEQDRALRALGFLTVGGRFMGNAHDVIDDRIDVVTRGLLGLTVSCARCHDHKFDPVPTKDYYSLYGIFASSEEPTVQPLYEAPPATDAYQKFATEMTARETKLRNYVQLKRNELAASTRKRTAEYLLAAHANRDRPGQEDFMLIADGNDLNPKMIVRWQGYLRFTKRNNNAIFALWHQLADVPEAEFAMRAGAIVAARKQTNTVRELDELYATVPKSMAELAARYASVLQRGQAWLDAPHVLGSAFTALGGYQSPLANLLREPDYPPNVTVGDYGDLDLLPDRPSQAEMQKLRKEVEQWRATGPGAPPRAMALRDTATPITPRVFQRGNPYNLGPTVPRQFLECLSSTERKPLTDGSGRLELAQAIASDKNPLTARVFVNRVWQHLFGRGLVPTAGDFGLRGEPPSHPELLDHLASSFMADGWSVKRLITRIVLSATYRQRSIERDEGSKRDPDNVLLWRMNRRRLGFEGLRDTLLAVSGKLNRTVGGPSVGNFLANNASRRTMYGHLDRLNVPGVYRTFDFPAPDATSAKRELTTIPPQALFMMNHPFVAECARQVLQRAEIVKEADQKAKLRAIYGLLFSRLPLPREEELALAFLTADPKAGWPKLVHALLMTNELMFVD